MGDIFDDFERVTVAILGSTGSIGTQALDVVRAYPDRFEVVALAAGSDATTLGAQAEEFGVGLVGLSEGTMAAPDGVAVITGNDSAEKVATETSAQVVLNAVVGAAGLHATMATLLGGKTLALANKESLVAAGEAVMAKAGPQQIRPVDSEHSALWQLLEGLPGDQARRIVVTGSGGPFRGMSRDELRKVTIDGALAHPVWNMGPKISIDSATLMNKGLEVIEAHFLFGFTYDEIDVVIHPQSVIHAMVETYDGAFYSHAAKPDMRLPIQVALAWPHRLGPPSGERVVWSEIGGLSFEAPDLETFPCLALAFEAGRKGDTYPAVLNAANEVAVQAFLEGRIKFVSIPEIVEGVLEAHEPVPPNIEGVLEQDAWARTRAAALVEGATKGGQRP
ncbi:MAG: 1-deoxy-D-xylulose-5-phosphate reductoisomerase [Actinomycetota bacterium]|nr:1-deoxy-D-xylulose-5-phosphate reductoisomerase [Actinomycetota bacterium]